MRVGVQTDSAAVLEPHVSSSVGSTGDSMLISLVGMLITKVDVVAGCRLYARQSRATACGL